MNFIYTNFFSFRKRLIYHLCLYNHFQLLLRFSVTSNWLLAEERIAYSQFKTSFPVKPLYDQSRKIRRCYISGKRDFFQQRERGEWGERFKKSFFSPPSKRVFSSQLLLSSSSTKQLHFSGLCMLSFTENK